MTKLVGPTRRHDPLHFRGLRLCPVFPRNLGKTQLYDVAAGYQMRSSRALGEGP